MAILSGASLPNGVTGIRIFGRARLIVLLVLVVLLVLCMAFSWTTRDAMTNLPFLGHGQVRSVVGGEKTLVDMRPWQTAQALAPLAVTAEESEFARDARVWPITKWIRPSLRLYAWPASRYRPAF